MLRPMRAYMSAFAGRSAVSVGLSSTATPPLAPDATDSVATSTCRDIAHSSACSDSASRYSTAAVTIANAEKLATVIPYALSSPPVPHPAS